MHRHVILILLGSHHETAGLYEAKIHLHAALARKDELLMGCLREKSKVFLLEEIIIFELLGIEASREKDMRTGLSMLRIR
jgi:predicted DNA-binding protein with PD1-like motif